MSPVIWIRYLANKARSAVWFKIFVLRTVFVAFSAVITLATFKVWFTVGPTVSVRKGLELIHSYGLMKCQWSSNLNFLLCLRSSGQQADSTKLRVRLSQRSLIELTKPKKWSAA